jgi:Ca2+-binding RTX toxin-like protein
MKNRTALLFSLLALATTALSSSARAAQLLKACPTTEDANNSVLHFDNFTPPASGLLQFYVGQVPFFGGTVVAACVVTQAHPTGVVHAILDKSNNLLISLPKQYNHLCLTGLADDLSVIERPTSLCGGYQFQPLNYNGSTLVAYGQGGDDTMRGGAGTEKFYGGKGNDMLQDYVTDENATANSLLYGEIGNDIVLGAKGNTTLLDGGDGRDNVQDAGGTSDKLYGGADDDCCLSDQDGYSTFDCGGGTDTVSWLFSGPPKTNCEVDVQGGCGGPSSSRTYCP